MAQGFAKGLFQGVILCGAALAALSLVLPLPESTALTGTDQGPLAETMSLPVGSEFARTDDAQPVAPAALTRPVTGTAAAPVAVVSADQPASLSATATAGRPESRILDPVAPVVLSPGAETVDLPFAPAIEAPIPVAPPGRVAAPTLDRQPEKAVSDSAPSASAPSAASGRGAMADQGRDAHSVSRNLPAQAASERLDAKVGSTETTAPSAPPNRSAVPVLADAPVLSAQDSAATARPQSAQTATTHSAVPTFAGGAAVGRLPAARLPAQPGAALDLSLPPDMSGLGLTNPH